MEFAPALFSTKVSAGRRTYFFDVKSAKNAKPFLKITQSELNGEERKKSYLNVFESEVGEFTKALEDVMGFMSKQNN
ncbi:MAG: hypothetical protein A3I07_03800 [Candidatus Doudnabacteria bacterium RIFCSPLOWO2_02_FULL_42_9]|uniref:DNA-binding protein n=1 Tax=Candidatus Doudnabacteria bacterium RIFCSPHIGHO2_01_FULL_41_86 TaxID=1817821 RepID=A0A1F5N8P7_9BACT|nr:MAG: hypothetical protein A2717_00510 [Candidatus Doudnabacteria bacterium RIFCSPHIGHO2_01_FULL_41_86]OGE75150.1 MAG: hypothetical protein A3K07_01540 [Candidatus Doudnabacteria bacterium RIFCSPHIGHO2_01_43_10]OGE86425.1 MAG: hypothetical protein A3E28_00385 [Candidatus Doudnabacteria bacterium RIFCSPHIGHO2_12_FULL_42_22]OGE87424.1 MAG: hypothetical protein A3C49_04370 [Candidatus Doudnabacteria bacterium RIFCSPHIGHO2_02_FULL_42_25]OGE92722.1 MAG: hypothetical protein A2895_03865 [Candidatus